MGKLAKRSRASGRSRKADPVVRLRRERQQLVVRLAQVDAALEKASRAGVRNREASTAARVDRLLDELADGLADLPALPADFSRADLYDDHD